MTTFDFLYNEVNSCISMPVDRGTHGESNVHVSREYTYPHDESVCLRNISEWGTPCSTREVHIIWGSTDPDGLWSTDPWMSTKNQQTERHLNIRLLRAYIRMLITISWSSLDSVALLWTGSVDSFLTGSVDPLSCGSVDPIKLWRSRHDNLAW